MSIGVLAFVIRLKLPVRQAHALMTRPAVARDIHSIVQVQKKPSRLFEPRFLRSRNQFGQTNSAQMINRNTENETNHCVYKIIQSGA